MPQIYVNTDNSNRTKKLFNASKLGSSAAAAEKKMQEAVKEVVSKQADFTTDTPGKGYSLKMDVVTEPAGRGTKYSVKIEILRYPSVTGKGGTGELSVPITARPGSATIEGGSTADIVDAIGELAKNNAKAALGPMRVDMTRR